MLLPGRDPAFNLPLSPKSLSKMVIIFMIALPIPVQNPSKGQLIIFICTYLLDGNYKTLYPPQYNESRYSVLQSRIADLEIRHGRNR